MALKTTGKAFRKAGFTLVELLVVVAIGAIISTLAITSYSKVLNSGALTTTSQAVIGLLDQARQTAITRNAFVEVRFYKLPASSAATSSAPTVYRAMQSFLVTNTDYTPLGKPLFFTAPMIIQDSSTGHSSLLDVNMDSSLISRGASSWGTVVPPVSTAPSLPTYGSNYAAVTFRFTPKGGLSLDASKQWFFSLIASRDPIVSNGLPANYAVLQVDGFTGKTTYYRP